MAWRRPREVPAWRQALLQTALNGVLRVWSIRQPSGMRDVWTHCNGVRDVAASTPRRMSVEAYVQEVWQENVRLV